MTRAALAKLLILVILVFIICLPEFFTLYRASKVNFLCLPHRPCERGKHVSEGKRKIRDSNITKKGNCDPSQTAQREKWEQACTQENQRNTSDPDSKRGSKDSEKSWFMCETDTDMAELHRNLSSSALKSPFTVSVALRLRDTETLKLTLFGLNNHSFLHLHPSEEEENGKEEGKEKDDEGQRKAFYCCLPALPTSESARQSHCLLWFTNQTVLTAIAKDQLPWKLTEKDEWRCVFRVLWLVLLCVMLLTIVTTVIGKVFLCKKPKVQPFGCSHTGQQTKDGAKFTDIPKGRMLHFNGTQSWAELSPIQELGSQDDIETLLEGNVEQCYAANLHHRINHAATPLTEELTL